MNKALIIRHSLTLSRILSTRPVLGSAVSKFVMETSREPISITPPVVVAPIMLAVLRTWRIDPLITVL